jgi:hypothetical protein
MPGQWTVVIWVPKLCGYVTWRLHCLPIDFLIWWKIQLSVRGFFNWCRKPNCLLPIVPSQYINETDIEMHRHYTPVYYFKKCQMLCWFCFTPAIDCPTLKSPVGGRIRGSGNAFGTVLRYECDSGLQLEGSIERRCLENGEWSGIEVKCKGTIYD